MKGERGADPQPVSPFTFYLSLPQPSWRPHPRCPIPRSSNASPTSPRGVTPRSSSRSTDAIAAVEGVTPAQRGSRQGNQPDGGHLRGRARAGVRSSVSGDHAGRRTHRHAAAQRRAPTHGGDRRLPAGPDQRDHHGGDGRACTHAGGAGRARAAAPGLLATKRRSRIPRAKQPRGDPRGRVRGPRRRDRDARSGRPTSDLPPSTRGVAPPPSARATSSSPTTSTSTRPRPAAPTRSRSMCERPVARKPGPTGRTRRPGTLKAVKGIGWFIEEYGIAQVSMNLVDITITPLHVAFDEVCRAATARGMRVTGSELVGLVPLQCLLDAGRYLPRRSSSVRSACRSASWCGSPCARSASTS